MANIEIAQGGFGDTGELTEQTLFYIAEGEIGISTDGGVTTIPFQEKDKFILPAGRTVDYQNTRPTPALLKYMEF